MQLPCALPQNPVSSPTEKQLLSLLKATDSDTGPVESSITCLVFMLRVERTAPLTYSRESTQNQVGWGRYAELLGDKYVRR